MIAAPHSYAALHGQPGMETHWGQQYISQVLLMQSNQFSGTEIFDGDRSWIILLVLTLKALFYFFTVFEKGLMISSNLVHNLSTTNHTTHLVSTALSDFNSISKERIKPQQLCAKPDNQYMEEIFNKQVLCCKHTLQGRAVHRHCESSLLWVRRTKHLQVQWRQCKLQQLGRGGKTTWLLYYSIMARWMCMCGCFKGLRSPQSIKTPLISPAFQGHFSGGELCWPLQTSQANQASLKTACSNVSPLFSPLQPQGKGIRGTSEMQPDGCSQCSEVGNSHSRLCHSHTC